MPAEFPTGPATGSHDDHSAGHHYRAVCRWKGSTAGGYANYDRTHQVEVPDAGVEVSLSSDSAFLGRPDLLNPEQLLLLAATSCQLLSFLAAAARARVDVVSYEDDARATMPATARPMRITDIVLRPRIVIRGAGEAARIRHLVEVGHRECFIANSLSSTIAIEPVIEFVD
jgi:organic hydroperoxide reductase OsmC/OhrA